MIAYFICFLLLAGLFLFLAKDQRTKRVAVILLVLSFVGELLIANFHSFHLIGGGYEATDLALSGEHVTIKGSTADDLITSAEGGSVTMTFTSVGKKAGTVYLDLALPEGTDYVDVKIDAKDVTQAAAWRSGVADGRILRGDDRSAYIVLDLSGEVSELRIRLSAPQKATFTVEGVRLNEQVPLHFSALRLVLFVLGCMAVYALAVFPSMKASYGENSPALRNAVFALTVVFVVGAVALTWLSMYNRSAALSTGFQNTWGNQITQELVDAFRAGQVHLLDTPPEELIAMENPYDWSARSELAEQGVSIKWDHLLFEGKYYSYYGIAPVLLLFLPYTLLTGFYFPTAEAILLFGGLGIIFLSLLFLEFARLFCKKIPNGILIATLVVLQMSSGVWYNLVANGFYEIAQSSGFMFTCAGFYFLLRSRIIGEGRIRYRHIVLGTMCLSWAVLCRPTLALYCFAACIFLVFGYLKHRGEIKNAFSAPAETQQRALRNATVKYLFASLSCFVIIGGIQMVYNYARFGSVLDFGIQYSLTINDFTRSQYHTDFVMIGLYNFLLAFPKIQPEFPYVLSNFSTLSTNGYYYVANRNAVGIFWRALPSLGYLGAVPAWKSLTRKERIAALCLLVPTCIIAPLIIIFSIWESGYGVRYCCDFAWQIILGGAAILYLLYARVAEGQGKTILRHAFTVAAIVAVIVNGAMVYDYLNKTGYLQNEYLRFARVFDFWL